MMRRPAVFLDRDGTINVDKEYLFQREDFEYTYKACDALKFLYDEGYLLVIITNQSGIARGYYSEDDYKKLNDWMLEDLKSKGIVISGTYYCPHHPKAVIKDYRVFCDCRKPETGLFYRAIKEHDIDLENSYVIGDHLRDISICKEYMVQGILLEDKQNHIFGNILKKGYKKAVWTCENLYQATMLILGSV